MRDLYIVQTCNVSHIPQALGDETLTLGDRVDGVSRCWVRVHISVRREEGSGSCIGARHETAGTRRHGPKGVRPAGE